MKKLLLIFLILFICLSSVLYLKYGSANAKLSENVSSMKQVGDFILHMRVDEKDKGIEVMRSIQYVGEEPVKIVHQSPLVSISIGNNKHDFTGSTVMKVLRKGDIYHPQSTVSFSISEKGECKLYVHARLDVNGERLSIEHEENLLFE
ncbi:hypothetical protein QGM71_16750 [Virgibacillus sp. C22-A2]|uniref:DUF4352 domain-containing protein n=1 Tax=Virgibacillus tibetensis TaxID=3042313 RepID=A0ABU6KIJ7_9BACI|nr:hypothetical protein [Virgibacillus sp. C22-A2]